MMCKRNNNYLYLVAVDGKIITPVKNEINDTISSVEDHITEEDYFSGMISLY